MKRTSLALALLASLAGIVHSADMPQGSRYDSRIQYVQYNPGDVVIVRSLPGMGTRIVFGVGEEVIDVASGFTQGWEFLASDNILYFKPKSVRMGGSGQEGRTMEPTAGTWDTNLMVRTNRRMYDFDLKLLSSAGNSGKALQNQRVAYRVEFQYPEDEAASRAKASEKAKTQVKLDEKVAPRNWAYSMQVGDASDGIAPTMAYDDGRFTYLKFPNNRDFPSVFLVAADKSESLVNTHVEKDVLVIQRVAREMVLRLGNAVVGVYNDKYDIDGVPPTDGTTVPGVKRVIVGGKQE